MRTNSKSLFIWIFLLSLLALVSVVVHEYYYPKKYLFNCYGSGTKTITNNATGEKETRRPIYGDTEFVRIYEYFWGLKYSINNFEVSECSGDFDWEVSCYGGEPGTPSERYEYFDIDRGRYSYSWNYSGKNELTNYSGNDYDCEKTPNSLRK
jgi:hypothetical protein